MLDYQASVLGEPPEEVVVGFDVVTLRLEENIRSLEEVRMVLYCC